MSTNNDTYPVVAGVDGTGDGLTAAEFGAQLAASVGRSLVLLHAYRASAAINPLLPLASRGTVGVGTSAISHGSFLTEDNLDVMGRAGRQALDAAERRVLMSHPSLHVLKRLVIGGPAPALVAASSEAVAVVVSRSQENSLERFFSGSTSHSVAAHTHCPTIVVPSGWMRREPLHRVVVGVQGSSPATEALTFAFQEAVLAGSEVVAIHAVEPAVPTYGESAELSASASQRRADDQRTVTEILAGWSELYPEVKVTTEFVQSPPGEALLAASSAADLIVVGARRPRGFGGLSIGSVARTLVAHADCPVVVIPQAHGLHHTHEERPTVEPLAMTFY